MMSGKSGMKMHSEIQRCICLSLLTERVVSPNNDKPLAQFVHFINNVSWLKVTWLAAIDMENLDGILQNTVHIDWKILGLCGRNTGKYELSQKLLVLNKAAVFFVQFGLQLERAVIDASLQHVCHESTSRVCHIHTVIMLELLFAQPEGLDRLLLDGIDLCNPKRSALKVEVVEGSSSGSVADRQWEGEQGTGVEES
jgi:hypothetical protein